MNIKRAKNEIKNALKAYLATDEFGAYRIPPIRQRPILLMGPPGIGKTQIMQQIAEETGVGLVSYTLTHHTRQSALGLPFIDKVMLGGEERTVTAYTMSEIIASVYREMERTGVKEGILFLDEINCISETLTPMMLQFLQCKTFGNQQLPAGWVVVAAGNPPEYNKSVREFDVVTLDRVKKIDIEEDFGVWKEYAYRRGIHGAILSYLEIRREHFYRVEATADGLQFVTARGWEDLSELMQVYESLGIPVDRQVVEQYLQLPQVASDFANYLQLYNKYKQVYRVDELLSGTWEPVRASELRDAPFDEKLGVLGLLLSRLSDLKVGRKKNLSTKNLSKIADYLNVPIEFLLNMEQKETPVLTRRDERDIAKRLDMILGDLGDAEASLMFDGEPIDDETRELLRISLQNQLEISKRIAKQKFTPKKYRK